MKDLVGDNDILKEKLFLELIKNQKDIETAHKCLEIIKFDINTLPDSPKEFYFTNMEIFQSETFNKTNQVDIVEKKTYYPDEVLNENNIAFIGNKVEFVQMLDFFEIQKPTIIGLDCEWKQEPILFNFLKL